MVGRTFLKHISETPTPRTVLSKSNPIYIVEIFYIYLYREKIKKVIHLILKNIIHVHIKL